MRRPLLSLPLLLALATPAIGPAVAQDSPAAPPPPCATDQHDDFDFWIGTWDVTQNGQPAGHNHIQRIDQGCALMESWTSATSNFTGHSLNFFDPQSGQWNQLWLDSSGTVLRLAGGLQTAPGGDAGSTVQAMVLEGETPGADGSPVRNRITWTPAADGSVRQHWETSTDGKQWTTAFDGQYVRAENAEE